MTTREIAEAARTARTADIEQDEDWCMRVRSVPAPFEVIADGLGSTRAVLKLGDKVFKIGDEYANETEAEWCERLRADENLPGWCYVPEAEYVDGVLVMEYIEGVYEMPSCSSGRWYSGTSCYCGLSPCWDVRVGELVDRYPGLGDLHGGNVTAKKHEDGTWTLILLDLGCS